MPAQLQIRESARVRRARIVVAANRPVEVVVPPGTPAAWIERFVGRHRPWIERRQAALAGVPSLGLQRAGVAWLHGQALPAPSGDPVAWYRRQARRELTEIARREGDRLGLTGWSRIRIGDQRSRWGSCSSRGTLSFSWRLVLAPRPVLDYVVVHELCHLRHAHHRSSFWRMVENAWPLFDEHRRWLREHGRELQRYRAAVAFGA
jgi:predicted metal-dependent hydrolase